MFALGGVRYLQPVGPFPGSHLSRQRRYDVVVRHRTVLSACKIQSIQSIIAERQQNLTITISHPFVLAG